MNKTLTPEFVTFTGIDDRTNLNEADRLASKYPIEWGVLLSVSNRDARYPCSQAIEDILCISGKKSAHLCGRVAREFQKGIVPKFVDLSKFDRVQVNGHNLDTSHFEKLSNDFGVDVIVQSRELQTVNSKYLQLFDCSGGEGVIPDDIPNLEAHSRIFGYAGGMGPETVIDYLNRIHGEGQFWIDMESRVRTKGWFDLLKVKQVCQLVYPGV